MSPEREKTGKRGRIVLATGLSLLVVVGAGLNIIETTKNPLAASLQDFGQWLSGVAGALAFIWLIVSYFQQGEELELQRKELTATREQLALQKAEMVRLADEAAKQAKSIEATEQHARRDTFMRLFDLGQSIEATLIRSLDASLFRSGVARESSASGRDFYISFATHLDSLLLGYPKQFRHVLEKNDQLLIYTWQGEGTPRAAWHLLSCRADDVHQLLWFDQKLRDEAVAADASGALVKFVQALPAQRALGKIRGLLSEATDSPVPERP